MATIQFEAVSHRRPGEYDALVDVDLDVDHGEAIAVVGEPGSGAATVLRLLAGFEEPRCGTIRIGSNDLAGLAPRDRRIALALPQHALYPHLTVAEHVSFPLVAAGESDVAGRVHDVAERLGLRNVLRRRPVELCPVERSLVALGRAIVRHPDVLLMDEPLSGLDDGERDAVAGAVGERCHELGVTTVVVVADRRHADALARRVVELDRGRCREATGVPV